MEEELKKESIEEIIETLEQHLKNSETMFEKFGTLAFEYVDIERIENLLKEYRVKELQLHLLREETNSKIKELEEENKKLIKANDNLKATKRIKTYREIEKHFIPISVIQNKIDEYDKMLKATYTDPTYSGDNRRRECLEALQVLQELLEERNK